MDTLEEYLAKTGSSKELYDAIGKYERQTIRSGHGQFSTRYRTANNRVNIGLAHQLRPADDDFFIQWGLRWLTAGEITKMAEMLQIGDTA